MKANWKKKLNKKIIAITLGDPNGIGPEIILKSLKDIHSRYALVVIGGLQFYKNKNITRIDGIEEIQGDGTYFLDIETGNRIPEPSFEYVKIGVDLALKKKIHAVVTSPISKKKWLEAGIPFRGHTEFLKKTSGVKNHSMFFWSENLKVALFTTHIPLKDIFACIKKNDIIQFIRFVNSELKRLFSRKFNYLISGLNPHAGENGFIGHEEINEIIPAIKVLKSKIDISGPYPPDAIFSRAMKIKDSIIISWYHDQGLIPFKLLNNYSGVNLTLGLPFIRTAPDHGTAYDIAGKGIADPSSMKNAIKLAEFLLQNRLSDDNSIHLD